MIKQEKCLMLILRLDPKLQCLTLSSLWHYCDAYILVKERITTTGEGDDAAAEGADGVKE